MRDLDVFLNTLPDLLRVLPSRQRVQRFTTEVSSIEGVRYVLVTKRSVVVLLTIGVPRDKVLCCEVDVKTLLQLVCSAKKS